MSDELFDEAARILASQVPRRRALRMLGGALVAAIVGAFGSTRAGAQTCSPPCSANRTCCSGAGGPNFCIPPGQFCCGNRGCGKGTICCGDQTAGFACCNKNQACVQKRCSASKG